jgi:nicotinamidase-related amidase
MTLPALLLIDMQRGIQGASLGARNNPQAEQKMADLLSAWREAGAPIVHVRHISRTPSSPFWPGQAGAEFQPALAPLSGEHVLEKNVPDAFVQSGLERWQSVRGVDTLVIVGVSTNISVECTARSTGNLGLSTYVGADATFTFAKNYCNGVLRCADEVHAMALANLQDEYAAVLSSAELEAQLLGCA